MSNVEQLARLEALVREPEESERATKGGAFMAYGEALEDHMRRQAIYADKLPRGAKPSELPVEQPTELRLVINLETARAVGLTIPPTMPGRANQAIES